MRTLFIFICLLTISCFIMGVDNTVKKICQFSELANPSQIAIGHNQIYFADGTTIYIYSLDKYKLLKKFGRDGEGPEEFKSRPNLPIRIILKEDCFYVSSLNKISKYKINGDYINEFKYRAGINTTSPINNNYVAKGFLAIKDVAYYTVNIYDREFRIIKELYKERIDPRNKINPIDATGPEILVFKDKIYINTTRNRNCFKIFNQAGKLINNIVKISPPIPLTEKIKENFNHFYQTDPKLKRIYEQIKSQVVFPKTLPLFRYILADQNNLIAISYPDANKKRRIYVFDLNGKLIKKIDSPLVSTNVEEVPPFTLYKGQLYQVGENDEIWELHKYEL